MVISNLVISLVSYCRKSLNLIFLESNHGQKLWIWPRFVSKKFKKSTFLANAHFESRLRNVLLILCVGRGMKKCREKNWQRHLWTAPNTAKVKLETAQARKITIAVPGFNAQDLQRGKTFHEVAITFSKITEIMFAWKWKFALNFSNIFASAILRYRYLRSVWSAKRPNHGLRTHDG